MYSRRDVCFTGAISSLIIAQSVTIAKSAPGSPHRLARPDHLVDVQLVPPLPNFKEAREFSVFLKKRFELRVVSRDTKMSSDGQKAVDEMIDKSMTQVFEVKEESGQIDKTKQYRYVPIRIRQAITIRNLDTFSDLAVTEAEWQNKKFQKGLLITAAVIQRIRDFICPMFPFCTA